MKEKQPAPGTEASPPPSGTTPPGVDTAFFMSRGRHLMHAPIQELLALCDRLVLQARALGRENLVPDFEKISEAAQHLLTQLETTEPTDQPQAKLRSLLASINASSDQESQKEAVQLADQAFPLPPPAKRPSILMVEDNEQNSDVVSLLLEHQGYATSVAVDGEQALEKINAGSFDLILLDILLPELNGYQVLEKIKTNPKTRHWPVIMLSGVGEMDSVVRCIEMGADDYLPKPFNPVLLKARIDASLEKKRLREQGEEHLVQIQTEREKSDILLQNILPNPIAERLKRGESTIADQFPDVTVLFADLVGFSKLAARLTPEELVATLNEIFTEFDQLAETHGLEKIKTIGDAYMVVGGLPTPREDAASSVALMALDMQQAIVHFNEAHDVALSIRIGFHSGPVIAGIMGRNKFIYDLWGDTVNVASRMESQGQPGTIQTTIVAYDRLHKEFDFEPRGLVDIKGKGEMKTYLLKGKAA